MGWLNNFFGRSNHPHPNPPSWGGVFSHFFAFFCKSDHVQTNVLRPVVPLRTCLTRNWIEFGPRNLENILQKVHRGNILYCTPWKWTLFSYFVYFEGLWSKTFPRSTFWNIFSTLFGPNSLQNGVKHVRKVKIGLSTYLWRWAFLQKNIAVMR